MAKDLESEIGTIEFILEICGLWEYQLKVTTSSILGSRGGISIWSVFHSDCGIGSALTGELNLGGL